MMIFVAIGALALIAYATAKFKTPYLVALMLALTPLPLYVGVFGIYPDIESLHASIQVVFDSEFQPQPGEVAAGGSVALWSVFAGLLLSLPPYLLSVVVLCCRGFRASKSE